MPFGSVFRPSIQIGLLKSIAKGHGFKADTYHLNLNFASQIGPAVYEKLSQHRGKQIGDWLFSLAAFGETAPDPDGRFLADYKEDIEQLVGEMGIDLTAFRRIRDEAVPTYLENLVNLVPWDRYRVVGFTSTFQQNAASFALSRLLKQRYPMLTTVFGGANFEGDMGRELVRCVDCMDYAVVGEGDHAFPELLMALLEGRDPVGVSGVIARRNGQVLEPGSRLTTDLDSLPAPDYTEYFERAESLDLLERAPRRLVDLPIETSRGCWWGQKHQCTFCGLNGETMVFRAKKPTRVLEELAELAHRHRSFQFEAVDNIMQMSYLTELFPTLRELEVDYSFFYEVKANLARHQVQMMKAGGMSRIQPGIESLNTNVLQLMRKGATAVQNVNLLRWCQYYGIDVGWNLLWGFPGEREEGCAEQCRLIPQLTHLQPPGGAGRIWMERFSPIYSDRINFPAKYIRPERSYEYVYPQSFDLNKVAYFFDYELEGILPNSIFEETAQAIERWQAAWKEEQKPKLTFWRSPGFLQIDDHRSSVNTGTYTFEGPLAIIYTACSDKPQKVQSLQRRLDGGWPDNELEDALDEFVAAGLMMHDDGKYLSLALPATSGR